MRIDRVLVRNFRGLRYAELSGLAASGVVTVSGPNGAGKSLLFEAIAFLWRSALHEGPLNVSPLIGPWEPTTHVELSFELTAEEQAQLKEYAEANEPTMPDESPTDITIAITITNEVPADAPRGQLGTFLRSGSGSWADIFWSRDFAATHPFSHLDYIPADRWVNRGEQAQVNPSLLSEQSAEGLRQQVFNSFVQQRQILNLQGVQPFLASLDYIDLLRQRDHLPPTGTFDALTSAFNDATGKSISHPFIDSASAFGATMLVTTQSGQEHGLDQLSSGEQGVLALLFL